MIYSILLVILVFILYILNIVLYIYKNNNRECFSNTSPYDITFIINLSETQEGRRRWNIIKNMSEFYNKIRFPAIYGKTYDYSEEIKKDIIKTEWDYGKWKYNKSKMISFDKGEIGVALSHYYIWKKIVDEDIDVALILEDDMNMEFMEIFFLRMKLPNYILKIHQVQEKLLNLNLHKILNF